MPAPRYRSRTFRRVAKKVASRVVRHYDRRKPKNAKCSKCGYMLHGVPRELPYKMRLMAKTKKRPERPFGGIMCSSCSRMAIIDDILTSDEI